MDFIEMKKRLQITRQKINLKKTNIYLLPLLIVVSGLISLQIRSRISIVQTEFPEMTIPIDNKNTKARFELGRRLFYDPILSSDSMISCASCHKQNFAFADNKAISPGVSMRLANRNAPTLTNVGFNPTYMFDGFLTTLEKQALVPIEEHDEMNYNIVEAAGRMKKNKLYVKLANKAYGREPDAFVITRALACFQRSLISKTSKFDQFRDGKIKLTTSELNGLKLFQHDLYCSQCHSGFNFTNFSVISNGLKPSEVDSGRMRVTSLEKDRNLFKVPTLRNIAFTAPYMHDGRMNSLLDVIEFYEKGGDSVLNKSKIIKPFNLSENEKNDLVNFLKTLSDYKFLSNKNYSNPFE